MSTRAFICFKDEDNYFYSYLHFDGYPSHTGKVLNEHWNTTEKANWIAALPDIRVINTDGTIEFCDNPKDKKKWTWEMRNYSDFPYYIKSQKDCGGVAIDFNELKIIAKDLWIEWIHVWNGLEWESWKIR